MLHGLWLAPLRRPVHFFTSPLGSHLMQRCKKLDAAGDKKFHKHPGVEIITLSGLVAYQVSQLARPRPWDTSVPVLYPRILLCFSSVQARSADLSERSRILAVAPPTAGASRTTFFQQNKRIWMLADAQHNSIICCDSVLVPGASFRGHNSVRERGTHKDIFRCCARP